jgi:acetyltransferase-like isoleucine patch superfamily enzyme
VWPADAIDWLWERTARWGAIRVGTRRARRFGRFGEGASISFPVAALFGERAIELGDAVIIGPNASLSAGYPSQDQHAPRPPIVTIGARTVIGKGSGIVGVDRIEIGADVWTGPNVYITDHDHGYEDVDVPIGLQFGPHAPTRIGDGSWLGAGAVVVGGVTVGRHVVIAAGAVVTSDLPDNCVAVGVPARVVRRYVDGEGWQRVTR